MIVLHSKNNQEVILEFEKPCGLCNNVSLPFVRSNTVEGNMRYHEIIMKALAYREKGNLNVFTTALLARFTYQEFW